MLTENFVNWWNCININRLQTSRKIWLKYIELLWTMLILQLNQQMKLKLPTVPIVNFQPPLPLKCLNIYMLPIDIYLIENFVKDAAKISNGQILWNVIWKYIWIYGKNVQWKIVEWWFEDWAGTNLHQTFRSQNNS